MQHCKSLFLSTTGLTAMLMAAAPAAAQDQPVPPDPAATAQQSPADPAQSPDAPQSPGASAPTDENAIVVTGLRRSLQSARNIKRNSDQIVDAIVAEDIGKLPDIAVSDTAARIPGIQVERNGGEASRVLLRGLDRSYYTTTYNGREIFTAETRSVALQDFPAGGISAVEVFKTSTANLVEPGLTGLINVRSRRPFDFKGFEVAGSVWGVWGNQARDFKPQGQILVTDRWQAGDSEFGALLNFSYTRLHYQDSIRRHGFFVANLAGFRSPDFPEIRYNEGDRWRPSINGALQFRNGDLSLYVDGLWQGYREELTDRLWQQPLWNCGQATYSNLVVEDGQIISGTVNRPGCNGDWPQGFQGATKRHTDTYQFAVGGSYDAGPLKISADLARTDSTFKLRTESVDWRLASNNLTVNWFTGRPGGSGPTFEVTGVDFADPSIYRYRGFFEDYLKATGKDWQGRLDFEYEPGINFLPKIEWGLRYVDRKAERRAGNRYFNANGGGFNIPITSVPLDYQLFNSAFHGDNHRPTPTTWMAPQFESVWDDLVGLRQFNLDQGVHCDFPAGDPTIVNCDTNDPKPDPRRFFQISEKSPAAYGQLDYSFNIGQVNVGGALGMRWVRTKDRIEGTLFSDQPNPLPTLITPITVTNKYTDWLPNANMNIRFNPQWTLRLAVTRTRTRPLFEQLNPSLELDQPNFGCNPALTHCARTGRGGNPFLDPLRSTNYDASLEYYFSRTGFASVAVFQRDMKGFIVNQTVTFPDPDPQTGFPIEITGPVNTNKGRIKGFEAQFSTFFDWDFVPSWARGFGAQANVTYIDPKIDLTVHGTEMRTRIPDVSKWTYNLVAMYEAHGLTARLSYNHRSFYPEGALAEHVDDGIINTLQGRGRPVGRLDLSTSYAFNDNFTIFFDWVNMLKKPFRSDIVRTNYGTAFPISSPTNVEVFPMVVRYEESVLSGGIRFRFGGGAPRAAAPPPPVLPPSPPPPVMEPAPTPAPPPPPAPPPSGERGF